MTQAVQDLPLHRSFARLARVSPATAFGIRYATAASAAIWLGHAPGLVDAESKWILITVLVVMQPMAGGSLLKAIFRIFGTAAAFLTSILLFGLFSQEGPLLLASFFLVQAVGAYGFTGPRYQYAWFVFAFSTGIILGDAMSGIDPVETIAFERASMVMLGILIALVVDALLWPTRSEASLRRSLAERARKLSGALRSAVVALAADAPSGPRDAAAKAAGSAPSPLAGQIGLGDAARAEIGVSRSRVEALDRVALLLEALAARERVLRRMPAAESGSPPEWERLQAVLAELGRGVEAALEESAAALASDRAPAPFAPELEQVISRLEAERARTPERAGTEAAGEGRAAGLRVLVALLRSLEEAHAGLASDSAPVGGSRETPARAAFRFQLDPFRVQIALRTGISVSAAVLLATILGWGFNNLIPPLAFMLAAAPTRGGALQAAVSLAAAMLLAWLVADLGTLYFTPHASRMPLALLFPFAVAGTAAFATASRPELDGLRKIGTLIALLAVYAGEAAPTNVEGAYDTVCFAALATGVGWVSTRLLWPATAATLFRERVAAQLELCCVALREWDATAEPAERRRQAGELLAGYAKQLAQLGSLHNQARHEPVERELDEERRTELLALVQDLCDAVFAVQVLAPGRTAALLERAGSSLAPLRESLTRAEAAILASMHAAAATVRAGAALPGPELVAARDALEQRLAELRARREQQLASEALEGGEFLVHLDSYRRLITRHLAIEQWLSRWRAAGAAKREPAQMRADPSEAVG